MVDAGSPRLVLLRDGEVSEQVLETQFPLGMFEGTDYREQQFQLRREDRLFVVSDGVIDATGQHDPVRRDGAGPLPAAYRADGATGRGPVADR